MSDDSFDEATEPSLPMPFDPLLMDLDLLKEEKLRTTALMLAIKYHTDTIVSDSNMYQAFKAEGKTLSPTTERRVVEIASEFERYILHGLIKGVGGDNEAPDEERAQATE